MVQHIQRLDTQGEKSILDKCDCCYTQRMLRLRIVGRMVYRGKYYQEEIKEYNWLCRECRKFFFNHFYGAVIENIQ